MRRSRSLVSLSLLTFAVACGHAASSPPPPRPTTAAATPTSSSDAKRDPASAPSPAPAPAPSAEPAPAATNEAPRPPDAPPPASDEDLRADVRASNAFTLKMLARTKSERGNVMVSGSSLRQVFGAAYLGAAGATAKEIAQTFGFPADATKAASAARGEIDAWKDARGNGAELTVANRIWVDKTMPVKPAYAKLVAWAFGAPATNVDFSGAPDEARRTVNGWIADQTQHKIEDLVPEGSVGPKTRAILTNAIYFKGKWTSPFPAAATKDEPFKLETKQTVKVPMMHHVHDQRFAHVGNVTLVELRYIGNDLSLLVVLPDDPAGLAKVEDGVTADLVDRWAAAVQSRKLDLAMPRFAFKWGGSVKSALEELGVKTAFGPHADLSGIAMSPHDLFVSDVFHRTWIALDEKGTEAAAATGMVAELTSLSTQPPTKVTVDHPFLFFVRGHGRILFAGRVRSPAQP